ncbi:MAG: DUF1801 domain-containing protein [Chloroflexi bacterium]|nr:DUF1801 domain-containing protein [Chloroflexota bacterium]
MAELKTKLTEESALAFLDQIENDQRRQDCLTVLELMKNVTGDEPRMWGESIVGFGSYHYRGKSGREGDWMLVGFSPRKQNLTLYIMAGFDGYDGLMSKLGKFKTGKSCLYINRLTDVDIQVLRDLIKQSVDYMRLTHSPE